MAGIEDRIIIEYSIDVPITGIRKVIGRNSDLLDPNKRPNPKLHRGENDLMKIHIWPDRPDTLDEEEITAYEYRVAQFVGELIDFSVNIEVQIAPFVVPAPQGP